MNGLYIFNNAEFGEIRTVEIDNEVWFVGKDVAEALKYKDTSDAIKRHVDEDDKLTRRFTDSGQSRDMYVINESGLYNLIISSKLENAKRFKKWITSEVLPTIRKTGGYVSNEDLFVNTYLPYADDSTREMFKNTLVTVRKQNEQIEQQRKELEHKEDVIVGLVKDIDLADKRQIINRVVRKAGADYQSRWTLLYREFENKYPLDIKRRMSSSESKYKTKIDYIDRVLNMIPELYEIACKCFENDVNALIKEMYEVVGS